MEEKLNELVNQPGFAFVLMWWAFFAIWAIVVWIAGLCGVETRSGTRRPLTRAGKLRKRGSDAEVD